MDVYKDFLGLGIAGNFALHLAQAGELEDFKDIITADEAAPKGMFPFHLPLHVEKAKAILNTYPLSSTTIKLPNKDVNIQAEPEIGLTCRLEYIDNKLSKIIPTHFGAYNDCSIRVKGASKISDKKNWGEASKGISDNLIAIDKFSAGGVMDNYSICSFLRRDGEVHSYGEDVELTGYSYFYEKLLDWMTNQINTQEDFGPLENLSEYISTCNNPKEAIISIGATRYTPYGECTFLKTGDEVVIVVYNAKSTSHAEVLKSVKNSSYDKANMSVLAQKVL
ncbi:hypothetical protein HUE87_09595 [Candidatus Sulfurimonas marisnigri]|uniref:Uncharacterized protein n=1 Tax=Candidatus Sulfurimonas marisnigri TaxID=2740405 RepID=A0A7S7LZ60_9BACT|nr:DUF5718 family protein [Candidatus Sulfurimonas marisnigri]QOY54129.1 hypothetical protein HUE87_09595 [Candidatus Sulfurimonas marisnigri]